MTSAHLTELDGDKMRLVSKYAKMTCNLTLHVPYSLPVAERTDAALRAGLTAYIDVSPGIITARPNRQPRATVIVVGLPPGVEVEENSMGSVAFDIERSK
jgi:hypothetical protein